MAEENFTGQHPEITDDIIKCVNTYIVPFKEKYEELQKDLLKIEEAKNSVILPHTLKIVFNNEYSLFLNEDYFEDFWNLANNIKLTEINEIISNLEEHGYTEYSKEEFDDVTVTIEGYEGE